MKELAKFPKLTAKDIMEMKGAENKITMLTAYNHPFAKIVDEAGIDIILVGDSMAMVELGHPNPLPINLNEIITATQAVARGAQSHSLIVGDLPFLTFGVSVEKTVENAGRLAKDGNAEAIKLEGGRERVAEITAITELGLPVMAHLGLTPQSIHKFGGFKVQGRSEAAAKRVIEDAKIVEEAGAFALVLEAIPWQLGKYITETVTIPTIGIGAGPYCDGQVLIIHDMLGLFEGFRPKFVKRYVNLKQTIFDAVVQYREEVRKGEFPDIEEFSYQAPQEEQEFFSKLDKQKKSS